MRHHACVIGIIIILLASGGCASNPNSGGEVVSGILMGIGQGLSGL